MTGPHLQQYEDLTALSQAAAQIFVSRATTAVTKRGRFLVALSGGGTPEPLYRLLAEPPYRDQIPWLQTHLFWGDERAVPPHDSGSNYRQVEKSLIQPITLPPENIHRIKGELDPQTAADDYAAELGRFAEKGLAWPRFDLVLLGLGDDGHTASLFPGPLRPDELEKPTIAVTADYQGRPANRVSLTPLVFNAARHIIFLVTGGGKAKALTAVLHGPANPEQWPAQRIQPHHGSVTWLVDKAAGRGIVKS